MANESAPDPLLEESPFRSVHSPGFADLLESLGITLLVTTYQAGKLMALRGRAGRVSTLLRSFERPMGLAVRSPWQIALGTRQQVWLFRNAPDLAPQIPPVGCHDACFLPRVSYVTGDIRGHEMAWVGDELWIVNTLFSCLCTLSDHYNFVPRWHPPFLAAPIPGDCCHLNGLASAGTQVRYVTALGNSTAPEGWRRTKADGGILIDVAQGEIIGHGLSMPHSPRLQDEKLWLLESGAGQLLTVAPDTGQRTVATQLPGFARGLAFFGSYAFVGLSKIRESSTFGDLPISARRKVLRCGIWIVDVQRGEVVEFLEFQAGIEEIFAVEVLPRCRFPEIVGFQQETVQGAFVLPPAKNLSLTATEKKCP